MTPTDVLNQPASDFWLDARIRAAGVRWENEQQQAAQQNQGSAGAATGAEKEELVQDQEARAERREQRDGNAPDLSDQLANLPDAVDHDADPGGDA